MSANTVAIAHEHYRLASEMSLPFSLTPLWCDMVAKANEWIPRFVHAEAAIYWSQVRRLTGFDHRVLGSLKWASSQDRGAVTVPELCALKLKLIKERFPTFDFASFPAAESEYSAPPSLCIIEDHAVSNVFFWHLNAYLACKTWLGSSRKILEVGAGYGGLARIFGLANPAKADYCIADLPTTLFFAEVFLRANFPEARMVYALPGVEISQDYDVLLVPAGYTEVIKDRVFDLAINMGSFQEMTADAIAFWMPVMRQANHFYSLNYAETQLPLDGWEVVRQEKNPKIIRIDASAVDWLELCLKERVENGKEE